MRNQRPYNVAYYARNREAEIARVRTRQSQTVTFLRELRRVPCADCGGTYEPWQMDFDHRDPTTKSFALTTGRAMLMSRERLRVEAAKCDIVCANCHCERTQRQHVARLKRLPQGTSPRIEEKRRYWRSHAAALDELRRRPCLDCGGRFPPCAIQFDHRNPTGKAFEVTRAIGRAGISRILAEAAKCDIVCANCHRMRTYLRRRAA